MYRYKIQFTNWLIKYVLNFSDDWEQEHEKFAIIEESFKKFSTTPFEEPVNNVTNVVGILHELD